MIYQILYLKHNIYKKKKKKKKPYYPKYDRGARRISLGVTEKMNCLMMLGHQ